MRFTLIIVSLMAAFVLPFGETARAQSGGHRQNELRRDVERGEVRPLSEILAAVRQKFSGEVVKVEVERHDGRWMYELRVLADNGRILEIHVDARTAAVERVKEK
jgi:uncharacterized membrane protein YkoI